MEENNYGESCSVEYKPEQHRKSNFWKYLLTGLLTLLGAFLAFYVVSDWHFKRIMDPAFQMRRFERAMMKQERQMENAFKRDIDRVNVAKSPAQFVHVEKFDDVYKVIIDLTPFDNNEKNVEIKTEGNTLTINAAGEKTSRNKQEIVKYSQVFAFGENIDANGIVKVREGNNYIITVPFD